MSLVWQRGNISSGIDDDDVEVGVVELLSC